MADWTDLKRDGEFHAYLVQPYSPTTIIEEMKGVFWDQASFSAGYYTSTRTSGQLKVIEGAWRPNTLIRIEYEIPKWNYRATIGTYTAKASTSTKEGDTWTQDLELYSMLYVLSRDRGKRNTLLAPRTPVSKSMKAEFEECGIKYELDGINDIQLNSPKLLEAGTPRLSRLYALCSLSGNRIDVSPYGIPTITEYKEPSKRAATFTIWTSGKDSLVFNGISRTNDYMETPNVAIVSYTFEGENEYGDSVDQQIQAHAALQYSDQGQNRANVFPIAEYYELDDLAPASQQQAEKIALRKLEVEQHDIVEWTIPTPYLPLWEGDIVNLMITDGDRYYRGARKCLVKTVEISAPFGDLKLTLKEIASGDFGDNEENDATEGTD